ncbi:hypothetical protein BDZ45DRAFT_807961 [Acephala macrosclerotiorum]|nr:hypothetical protein BDZ45DRAFT_807961 [Acephala macrosclerotiorum]
MAPSSQGKWSGVKPEWDDNIHIKNNTVFPFVGKVDHFYTSRCTVRIGNTGANFMYNVVLVYYGQIAQFKADPQGYIWNALNAPFVQTIVVTINSRKIPGHATSEIHDTLTDAQNQMLALCQSSHDQTQTLIALGQASLEQQRKTNALIASATPDGENPAMVGSCNNGPTPNSKRDMEIEAGFLARFKNGYCRN